jgi:hypothetical protein
MTCRTPLFRILTAVFAGHCSAHAAFAADPAGQWLAEFDSPRGRQRDLFDAKVPMEKNAGGFWSVTCGLVAPGFHYCTFLVDGANPCNP